MSKTKKEKDELLEDEETTASKGEDVSEEVLEKAEAKVKTETKASTAPAKVNIEKRWTSDAMRMKGILDAQPKVDFYIPLAPGEKPGPHCVETVQINGYKYVVKKGEMVRIPQQVFEMLAEYLRIGTTAGREKLVDRDSKVEEALN